MAPLVGNSPQMGKAGCRGKPTEWYVRRQYRCAGTLGQRGSGAGRGQEGLGSWGSGRGKPWRLPRDGSCFFPIIVLNPWQGTLKCQHTESHLREINLKGFGSLDLIVLKQSDPSISVALFPTSLAMLT